MEIADTGTQIRIVGEYRGKKYTDENPYIIDLTPVRNITEIIHDYVLGQEENRRERKLNKDLILHEKIQRLNKDQLEYLVNDMQGIILTLSMLYQTTLDDPEGHLKFVQGYRKLMGLAKKTIFGEGDKK